jgi:sugar phosphate isomerase/epimerase
MNLNCYRHLWGVTQDLETALPTFKATGYEGIECWLAVQDVPHLASLLRQHQLPLIAQILTMPAEGQAHSVKAHLDSFERQLELALSLAPVKINLHGGWDAWSHLEQGKFMEQVLPRLAQTGLPAGFETHRSRITSTPWNTRWLLEQFPEMRLTLDLSHWVVVCERLPLDQLETIQLAASRAVHVHARVGFEQGPQVSDPRAPEFATHLAVHESWWEMVWQAQAARGEGRSSLTPEFGPTPYLPSLPYTQAPVADLSEICDWMMQRQKIRFAQQRL